jgi:hypothetical protein
MHRLACRLSSLKWLGSCESLKWLSSCEPLKWITSCESLAATSPAWLNSGFSQQRTYYYDQAEALHTVQANAGEINMTRRVSKITNTASVLAMLSMGLLANISAGSAQNLNQQSPSVMPNEQQLPDPGELGRNDTYKAPKQFWGEDPISQSLHALTRPIGNRMVQFGQVSDEIKQKLIKAQEAARVQQEVERSRAEQSRR